MDVDSSPLSGSKRSSDMVSSSSSNKRLKLNRPSSQLAVLNQKMMEVSSHSSWEAQLEEAGTSDRKWRFLFTVILMHLSARLYTMDMKNSVSPPLNFIQAQEIAEGFNQEVFWEWRMGAQKGALKGDWSDIVCANSRLEWLKT